MKERIIKLIKEQGLSLSEFAKKLKIDKSGISHLVSGRNKPSIEFLLKLKKEFPDIDLNWFVTGNKEEKVETEKPETTKYHIRTFENIEIPFKENNSKNNDNSDKNKNNEVKIEPKNEPQKITIIKEKKDTSNNLQSIIKIFDDNTFIELKKLNTD